jgi:hypothetical protein
MRIQRGCSLEFRNRHRSCSLTEEEEEEDLFVFNDTRRRRRRRRKIYSYSMILLLLLLLLLLLPEAARTILLFHIISARPLNRLFFFFTRPRLADALRCRGY